MTVTIIGTNTTLGITDKLEGVDYNLVTIKEINKRNGYKATEVRVQNGTKRDTLFKSGYYRTITIQDEETGRYILRLNQ